MSTIRRRAVQRDQWGKPDRNEAGQPICRWCRNVIAAPRRRTFCSDACVHEWRVRSSPSYVRGEVWKRDRGICGRCGFNLKEAESAWRRTRPPKPARAERRKWRAARPRWEADHILPVADGGGECGLENYRLLCRACHVVVTAQWRRLKVIVRAALTRRGSRGASPAAHSSA
ncbi:MAG TPA: HNH endonuclease [Vicinamibacterales bacterium]|nr:HNH endonuclease [Vicinamibacterales bacterium]